MRLILPLLVAISAPTLAQTSGVFTIKGTLMGGIDSDTVILAAPAAMGLSPIDTARVSRGTFTFSGTVDGASLLYLVGVKGGRPAFASDVVAEAGSINVRLYKDPDRAADVVGNVTNSLWRLFAQRDNDIVAQAQPYVNALQNQRLSPDAKRAYQNTADSLATERMANVVSFVKGHKETLAADLVFEMYAPMLNEADCEALAALLAQNKPQKPGFKRAKAKMEQGAAARRSEVGRKFTDFACPNRDGDMVRLSDIVKANKVTLLDFWASWCGPCRMEMPNVRGAYDAFHAKGLEVVGVSLDGSRDSWLKAIESLKMPWVHLSDLKGWQCAPAQLYGVHSIPASILIAQDGTILAKDLRGAQLIITLNKILK